MNCRVLGWGRLEGVGGAGDSQGASVQDMGVDHRGLDVPVAEEFLDDADVGAIFEEVGGEGVAQDVAGDASGDAGSATGGFYGAL